MYNDCFRGVPCQNFTFAEVDCAGFFLYYPNVYLSEQFFAPSFLCHACGYLNRIFVVLTTL